MFEFKRNIFFHPCLQKKLFFFWYSNSMSMNWKSNKTQNYSNNVNTKNKQTKRAQLLLIIAVAPRTGDNHRSPNHSMWACETQNSKRCSWTQSSSRSQLLTVVELSTFSSGLTLGSAQCSAAVAVAVWQTTFSIILLWLCCVWCDVYEWILIQLWRNRFTNIESVFPPLPHISRSSAITITMARRSTCMWYVFTSNSTSKACIIKN